jgi:phosphoribosyl 1,2-cyclic phosphodiesterase
MRARPVGAALMTLHLRFWGTRGSVPAPGAETVRYGGNTPCLEVRTETNGLVILDAGTGLRPLGRALLAEHADRPIVADIFLSHAHWDHIQGIPFFEPIYESRNRFRIWAPSVLEQDIGRVVRSQMSPAVFPVAFADVRASVDFCEFPEGAWSGEGYRITGFEVQHPGGALGYRLSGTGRDARSFVYVSDNELGSGELYRMADDWRRGLVEFIRGAVLLVHDSTYTAEEYQRHRGWGHSTDEEAVLLALDAGVEELVLFHHKPERTDDEVDRSVARCQALVASRGGHTRIRAAAEGLTLNV